jgi:hypothetical protein
MTPSAGVLDLTVVKNQSLCRDANEQAFRELGGQHFGQAEFTCECGDLSCGRRLTLALEEYEAVRRFPTRFLVSVGHDQRSFERVVEEHDRYCVVEKFGPGGIAAIKLARRSRPFSETAA